MAEQYEFLSPEWIEAAKQIRDEMPGPAEPPTQVIRMNQVITEPPFGDGETIRVHLDTSDGELRIDRGHLDDPDLTVTVDWTTAKAIFVELDAQVAMQAFMAGKIKVTGDITKLMALQQASPDPAAAAVAARIRDITA